MKEVHVEKTKIVIPETEEQMAKEEAYNKFISVLTQIIVKYGADIDESSERVQVA